MGACGRRHKRSWDDIDRLAEFSLSTKAEAQAVPILSGLSKVAEAYDLVLSDVWGVVHNGDHAHPGACEALARFRDLDGARPRRVVLISNAPGLGHDVIRLLDEFGVPRASYDAILTAGDLTRAIIAEQPSRHIYHLGTAEGLAILDGLDAAVVGPGEAELVLCTGLRDDLIETAEDYRTELRALHKRSLPMVCANPDLVMERGGRLIPCAGHIAQVYEELGGSVTYAGKPYRPIYARAVAQAEALDGGRPLDPARILAVGDAMRTDVAGAHAFGVACLFVARGIHADEMGVTQLQSGTEGLTNFLKRQQLRPDLAMNLLKW